MLKAEFILTGEMPLLMHPDDVEASDSLKAWRQDPANKNASVPGDDRSPAWTWQMYLYSDGQFVTIPSANLMVSMRQAGSQLILKKQKTYKEISQSGLLIPTEFLHFSIDGTKQIAIADCHKLREMQFAKQASAVRDMGFRLFVKRAKIGTSKHVRVRPRFDKWQLKGSINILTPDISWDTLGTLFDLAGRVGLCDWRPGCKTPGPYGMFTTKIKKC